MAELKQGYKLTDVGILPEDWQVKPIGELAITSSGTTPSRDAYNLYYKGGEVSWVKTGDLNNSKIFTTQESITKLALSETSLRLYPSGTVLIAMYGGYNQIGRTGLLQIPASVNQAITAIQPNDHLLTSEYLISYLNFKIEYWKRIASSSRKDPNITGKDVRDFLLAYPPVMEQRAIAAALSEVDDQLAALDALITKKRDLKQAVMQRLLTGEERLPGFSGEWEEKSFGEIFIFLSTANNPRSDLSGSGEIEYIHYGDIHTKWNSFLNCDFEELPRISKVKVQGVPYVQDGDLIMADASEDYDGIGASVEVKNAKGRNIVAGLHTLLLRGKKEFLSDGFKGYLQYIPAVKDSLIRLATGISVYGISKNNIKSISVHIPDTIEQQSIVTILSDMDAEIAALEEKREKTVALKKGMMQELLTGKTRLV